MFFIGLLLAFAPFATFGRFNCLHKLTWKNVSANMTDPITITLDKRKNDQFRKGSEALIPEVEEIRKAGASRLP